MHQHGKLQVFVLATKLEAAIEVAYDLVKRYLNGRLGFCRLLLTFVLALLFLGPLPQTLTLQLGRVTVEANTSTQLWPS